MAIQIKKAVKFGAKLRLALFGPSGSGKTYTALSLARELAGDKRVCVIDTERGSASKYADEFDFDVIELESFSPQTYIDAIKAVAQAGDYSVLVIDSASHEWEGSRGALELVGQNFTNWSTVTPLHNKFIDAMLATDIHVIATMRAKEEHVMEKEEGKKAVIRKMGMEPIQRKGMQYEFDIVGSLTMDNRLTVEKTRCSSIKDAVFSPGDEKEIIGKVKAWLDGAPAPARVYSQEDIKAKVKEVARRAVALGQATDYPSFFKFAATQLNKTVMGIEHLTMDNLTDLADRLYQMELQQASERKAS